MLVDEIRDSPILSLIDRIFELRRRGEAVLGLHIGEPDFPTPAGIQRAASDALADGLTHYVSAQGLPELRAAIADRARSTHGIPATEEDVVVLPAKFAIYATLLATLSPSEEVLLPDPTYLFEQPVRLAGGRPVYVPLREDFSLDGSALEAAVSARSRVVLGATPANPTGHVMTESEADAVLEVARAHDLWVVSDETYDALVYEGLHVSPAARPGAAGRVVTIGSFSKTYAMTGWRAGYLIAPPAIRARVVKVVEHTLTCLPPFIQRACLYALEHGNDDARRFRELFRERRDRLLARLESVPHLQVARPRGAFYLFPSYDLPVASTDLAGRLLAEEHVAVVPGVAFGPRGEGHLRISYTSPLSDLEIGAERLRHFFERA